jgi:DNA polymerase-3 subunit alpha
MLGQFVAGHIGPGRLRQEHVLQAIANTRVIAEQLDFKWQGMATSLPTMHATPDRRLMELCVAGIKRHGKLDGRYLERLKYEFGVIQQSGFLSYFLVLHDIVAWARQKGIMVGPGRGSAAGSLVSYALGITSVDPIEHGMMFERFYRPGRMDLPDIDTDFEDVRRDEVLDYIVQRFGGENVSKIATYGTLGAKGAIKDVARVFGLDHVTVNEATRVVDPTHMTDDEVFDQPSIKALFARYDGIEPYARALTGVLRGTGEHASGIVVAGEPLKRRGVLWRSKEKGGLPVINWDMRQAEKMGLMKLDVLGLRTLQIIRRANDNIQAAHGKRITFEELPLDDPRVLELFNDGESVAIFQFESGGIRKALKEVGVSSFNDIVAVNALYRPGPMEYIPVYASGRRDPGSVWYQHPALREHLQPTYGVMIYQEQLMSIAKYVAGFDWNETDHLRKAVGKKLPEEMAKLGDKFTAGLMAGKVEITLDDGRVIAAHLHDKFRVEEDDQLHQLKEIIEKDLTIIV